MAGSHSTTPQKSYETHQVRIQQQSPVPAAAASAVLSNESPKQQKQLYLLVI